MWRNAVGSLAEAYCPRPAADARDDSGIRFVGSVAAATNNQQVRRATSGGPVVFTCYNVVAEISVATLPGVLATRPSPPRHRRRSAFCYCPDADHNIITIIITNRRGPSAEGVGDRMGGKVRGGGNRGSVERSPRPLSTRVSSWSNPRAADYPTLSNGRVSIVLFAYRVSCARVRVLSTRFCRATGTSARDATPLLRQPPRDHAVRVRSLAEVSVPSETGFLI